MSGLPPRMTASVLTAPRQLELQERELPALEDDQVLVEVSAVGVCGSDAHFWADGTLGDWVVRDPLVLGHESAGRIVAVGSQISPSRLGERISIEPQRPVATSRASMSGSYNLDPDMQFYATPGVDGAFAQYVAIQGHFAWPVPDAVSDNAAALLEPLSVAIAAGRKANFTAGARILVAGAGPIGVLVLQVARAFGASEVIVADPDPSRRELARRFGAQQILDPGDGALRPRDLAVDCFVDASGAPPAIWEGIHEVRPGGTVVLVGMGPQSVEMPMSVIQNRELVVTGVFRYANTWPIAIDLVARGAVDLDAMITGYFSLAEVEQALESVSKPGTLKSIVLPNGGR